MMLIYGRSQRQYAFLTQKKKQKKNFFFILSMHQHLYEHVRKCARTPLSRVSPKYTGKMQKRAKFIKREKCKESKLLAIEENAKENKI